MNREDIQKLLGGYATGTLTPEEQQALFSAALEDQELFDALAREQALRDLLDDPGARAQLLAAIDEKPEPWYARWWRPAALALATASIAVLAFVAVRQNARHATVDAVRTMAEAKPPAPAPAAPRSEAQPAAKEEADQAKPAQSAAQQANSIRARKQFVQPNPVPIEPLMKEKLTQPAAPEPPPQAAVREVQPSGVGSGKGGARPSSPVVRDVRPTGVGGAIPSGAPAAAGGATGAAPPPTPAMGETRSSGTIGGTPGGVVGGVIGGVPAALPPPPPAPKMERAKDLAAVADFADAESQRARRAFFAAVPAAGFVSRQNLPAANAQSELETARPTDQKQQQQKAQEQARTMIRGATGALAVRATPPPGVAALGIRYTLLRKTAEGTFTEIAPGGLQANDTVEIRFEANQDGFLSVVGPGSLPIVASNVTRRTPYTTAPIEPGPNQLTVRFSRQPLTGVARPSGSIVETPADAGDRATYVAVANPLTDPLVFTIALR